MTCPKVNSALLKTGKHLPLVMVSKTADNLRQDLIFYKSVVSLFTMNIHAPTPAIKAEWPAFDFIGKRRSSNGLTFIKVKLKTRNTCYTYHVKTQLLYCFEKNAIGINEKSFDNL